MNSWPTVPLGQVLRHRKDFTTISDLETYKRCRVQLHAQGIVLRDIVLGAEIKTKKQQVCRAGEFLVAEIDAKVGGYGIVPDELNGAIVSSHYFLFEVDSTVLDRRFLDYFCRTPGFQEQVTAKGTTNYAAIRPSHVLGYKIPLPPLDEQRRIVARIEELAGKIEEARGLRRDTLEGLQLLQRTAIDQEYSNAKADHGTQRLGDLCISITDGNHLTPAFSESGIKFVFVGNVSSGYLHFGNCKFVRSEYYADLKPQRQPQRGDILYSAVGATLGIPAIVDTDEPFCFQRHIAILKLMLDRVVPQFAWYMLRSATMFRGAWENTTGSAQPTVPLGAIRNFALPTPSISEQQRIVAYLDDLQARMNGLTRLQAETAAELDALLPSILDRAFKGEL